MGQARLRGSYEERKAHPQGRMTNPPMEASILALIERGYQKQTASGQEIIVPVVRRTLKGNYTSRDGRTYHFDGKMLRRITPTQ